MRASTTIAAASLAVMATLLASPVNAAPILGSAGAGLNNAGIPMENNGRYWDGNSWDSQGLTDGGGVNPCNIGSLAAGTPCGLNADAHDTATLAGHPLLEYTLEHGELGFQAWTNTDGSADLNFGFDGSGSSGWYDFAMLGEFTGDWAVNEIGWYELGNPENRHTIFTSDAAVGATTQVYIPTNFGFYYLNTSGNGEMYFTQSAFNSEGSRQQFAAFQLNDYTILGVEDIFSNTISGIPRVGTSDYDYNDVIFGYRSATHSVPEPGTLLLLGMGLAGIVAHRRRKA